MPVISAILKQWKVAVVAFVVIDMLIVVGLLQLFTLRETERVAAAELANLTVSPSATAPATATPWPGPGLRNTPTATKPPTPMATDVLAAGGFPLGFTPTPRPTREKMMITLPYVYPVFRSNLDVPEINQVYYPEPFFPPGTNNACGPVALYAAMQALGVDVDYSRLRDHAVYYGFTSYGISKSGMVGAVAAINQEMGEPLRFEHGDRYSTKTLIEHIRKGGVAIVLIRVQKVGGQYHVTSDLNNSIGHFLIVDSINLRSKTVQFAGSTLGMESVPLQEFIQSWSRTPYAVELPSKSWQSYLKNEPATNWALIIRRGAHRPGLIN